MPYWEIVTRSFSIAWRHKYLWLIAFFSGEAGGGSFSFNYSYQSTQPSNFQEQVTSWINAHVGLLITVGIIWLVLAVVLFFVGAICEGATVRASAEHDAERPFGLRLAWTMGLHTMWVIVRFRLLLFLLYLPLLALIAGWVVWLLTTIAGENSAAAPGLVVTGLLLFLVFVVYAIYLFFLDRFGTRAAILEERKAIPSIARAHSLLFKRFGRSLLVWLLAIAVAIVVGIAVVFASALIALPLAIALVATGSSGSAAFWPILAVSVIIFIPVYFVVYGFLGAQGSTYWTVAFRRMDIDYAPAYPYPYRGYPPAAPVEPR